MELTSQRKLRGSHARALYTTATVNAISGAPDEERAERHFVEGLTLADELGMRPLVAQCHQELGLLLRRAYKAEAADVHIGKAAELFCTMNMPYWLAQTESAPVPAAHERRSPS